MRSPADEVARYRAECLALQKELASIKRGKVIAQGIPEDEHNAALAEIAELKKRDHRSRLIALEAENHELRKRLDKPEARPEPKPEPKPDDRIRALDQARQHAIEQATRLRDENGQLGHEVKTLKRSLAAVRAELESIKARPAPEPEKPDTSELDRLREQLDAANARIRSLRSTMDAMRDHDERRADQSELIRRLKNETNEQSQEIKSADREIGRLNNQVRGLKSQAATYRSRYESLRDRLEKLAGRKRAAARTLANAAKQWESERMDMQAQIVRLTHDQN